MTEEQLEALRLFAGYVGLALENARLLAESTDALAREQSGNNPEQARLQRENWELQWELQWRNRELAWYQQHPNQSVPRAAAPLVLRVRGCAIHADNIDGEFGPPKKRGKKQ
jgi:hypothetical protein